MQYFFSLLRDVLGLIYPDICVACGSHLPKGIRYFCPKCLYDLPRTHFHQERDNPVEQVFWGRVPVWHAASWFHYFKGSRYQKVIYLMKYHGKKELGYEMGRIYGRELLPSPFADADLVVPVPLHPKKIRQRGFNQSEWIAKGLAEALEKPLISKALIRTVNTRSQTRKSRIERWENVKHVFQVRSPNLFQGKHILLVDDVITTGATLEACSSVLTRCENASVSIVTLGYTDF